MKKLPVIVLVLVTVLLLVVSGAHADIGYGIFPYGAKVYAELPKDGEPQPPIVGRLFGVYPVEEEVSVERSGSVWSYVLVSGPWGMGWANETITGSLNEPFTCFNAGTDAQGHTLYALDTQVDVWYFPYDGDVRAGYMVFYQDNFELEAKNAFNLITGSTPAPAGACSYGVSATS